MPPVRGRHIFRNFNASIDRKSRTTDQRQPHRRQAFIRPSLCVYFSASGSTHRIPIPYERDFTLLGNNRYRVSGDANQVAIDQDETTYLCELANRYFQNDDARRRGVSYAGVRPLVDDTSSQASDITRDYRLEMDNNGAPLLSIFGGKITTFRKLAEDLRSISSRLSSIIARSVDCRRMPAGRRSVRPTTGQSLGAGNSIVMYKICRKNMRGSRRN